MACRGQCLTLERGSDGGLSSIVIDSWRHKDDSRYILCKWSHLSHWPPGFAFHEEQVRKSSKAQISSNRSQNTSSERRKEGRHAVVGGISLPHPCLLLQHSIKWSALLCPSLSSHLSRPNITNEKIDVAIVLVPRAQPGSRTPSSEVPPIAPKGNCWIF